ncbi:MAG: UDP-N-acetylmuramoyl-L-alanyl-D-glutamate--2,6-diaminopimelate ligase [Corynebacterium sp.]|nr:UDP-N-acetylmuramoyl-L-alanyl-D-glutamate--2,6-diaminopimelate ligase [Corynebacterium sp.]
MDKEPPLALTLDELSQLSHGRVLGDGQVQVDSVSLDSTDTKPDGLFAAVPGTHVHGAHFALSSGAAAVITNVEGVEIMRSSLAAEGNNQGELPPILLVDDVRSVLGIVSAAVYDYPTRELTVLGVTGTSGKTTTSYLLEAGLLAAGQSVGIIGTTGTRINGVPVPSSLTTPEAPKLQELFAQMRAEGVTHVVMEVSSHALALGRVQGTDFDVAGFTNLSQDHLDFHPTMEDYFRTKAELFLGPDAARRAVVCINDDWGERLAAELDEQDKPVTVVNTTVASGEDEEILRARIQECMVPGTVLAWQQSVRATGEQHVVMDIQPLASTSESHSETMQSVEFDLPLPGEFNVANAALATAMAQSAGVDIDSFIAGIAKVSVPGRMQKIDQGQDFVAVVDYAHKPAAVAAVLDSLREQYPQARIGVVIGAGGDRDASKRPVMGAAAAQRADLVVVTDDNPRSEEPAVIRAAVMEGARSAQNIRAERILDISDRSLAIAAAIEWARPGDCVIVLGKGHEVGQIVGDETLPFDDREEVSRALNVRLSAAVEIETEESNK